MSEPRTTTDTGEPSPAASGCRWGIVVLAALLFGALSTGSYFVAIACASALGGRVPPPILASILIVGAKALTDRLAPRANAPLLPLATWTGVLAMVPVFFQEMIASTSEGLHFLNLVHQRSKAPLALFPVTTLGVCAGAMVFRLREGALARVRVRLAALATIALAGSILVAGLRNWKRPGLDRYIGELESHSVDTSARLVKRWSPWASTPDARWTEEYRPSLAGLKSDDFADFSLVQECDTESCRVGAVPPGAALSPDHALVDAPRMRSAPRLTVLHHKGAQVLVLPDCCASWMELEDKGGRFQPAELSPARVAERVGVPIGWLVSAGVAMLVLASLWAARGRARRMRDALQGAKEGHLGTDGWVTVDASPPVRLDPGVRVSPGPVVLINTASTATYRGSDLLSRREVLPGSLGEQTRKLDARIARADMAITAVGLLASAPLVAAILVLTGAIATSIRAAEPPRVPEAAPSPQTAELGPWEEPTVSGPVVVPDVNGDQTEDVLAWVSFTRPITSGVATEHLLGLFDGKTLKLLWSAGPLGGWSAPHVAVTGGRAVVLPRDRDAQILDLRSGRGVKHLTVSDPPQSVCAPADLPDAVWMERADQRGVLLDVFTGAMVPAEKPASCPPEHARACGSSPAAEGLCGASPSALEASSLQAAGLSPRIVFRSEQTTLVVGTRPSKAQVGSDEATFVLGLSASAASVLWEVDLAYRWPASQKGLGGCVAVMASERLYTFCGGRIAAFDVASGRQVFDSLISPYAPKAPTEMVASGERIYVSHQGRIHVLDARTGASIGTIEGT